jgi:hypothetical protein
VTDAPDPVMPHRQPAPFAVARLAVFVVAAAVAAALWLWLWPRPLGVQLAPRDAPAVAALAGSLAVGPVAPVTAGTALVPGPSGCAALVRAGPSLEPNAVRAGRWSIAPAPQTLDTLTCVRWRTQLVEAFSQDTRVDSVRPGGDVPARTGFDTALLTLAALLSGACLALLSAVWRGQPPAIQRLGLAVVVAVAAVHVWWPHRLTTVYFAYEYFAAAHYLDNVPRYGPGGPAFWGLVLGPLAVDHIAALWLQTGLFALGAAAWSMALARRFGLVAGGFLAVVQIAGPLWLRESSSESLHIGAVAAMGMAALGLASAGPDGTGPKSTTNALPVQAPSAGAGLWLAGLGLGWACLFRVDATPLLLAMALLLGLAAGLRNRQLGWAVLLAVPAVLAAMVHAGQRAVDDLDRNNLPQLAELPQTLLDHLVLDNLLVRGDWLPLGLWLPVVAWLALGRIGQRVAWWLLAWLGVLAGWLLVSWLDFNETSLPRLQWPAAQMLAVLAAGAVGQLSRQWPAQRVPVIIAGLLALAGTAVPTLPQIGRPTVPDAEDLLWRRAAAALPHNSPYWLVTRTYAEGPAQGLHLHLPTWLVQPPGGEGKVVSLSDWQSLHDRGGVPPHPVYFLRSARCYAAPLHGVGAGSADTEHPACAAAWSSAKRTIFESTMANVSDRPTFAWYGRSEGLQVGLYCLSGCPRSAGPP